MTNQKLLIVQICMLFVGISLITLHLLRVLLNFKNEIFKKYQA